MICLPGPRWGAYARIQQQLDSRHINCKVFGADEAAETILSAWSELVTSDEIAAAFDALRSNRSAKFRRRIRLAGKDVVKDGRPLIDDVMVLKESFDRARSLVSSTADWDILWSLALGETYGRAARRLGVAVGTVKARASRLRAFLRSNLNKGKN